MRLRLLRTRRLSEEQSIYIEALLAWGSKTSDWEYLGSGRNRAAFRRGNYVAKVPLSEEGIHDNIAERDRWLRYGRDRGYIKYARCRLYGGCILVMQYAHFPVEGKTDAEGCVPYSEMMGANEWALGVDCQQVGYNRFGQLVAYDYGVC